MLFYRLANLISGAVNFNREGLRNLAERQRKVAFAPLRPVIYWINHEGETSDKGVLVDKQNRYITMLNYCEYGGISHNLRLLILGYDDNFSMAILGGLMQAYPARSK